MVSKLTNRPLLGTIDSDLFVSPACLPELVKAIERGLNTLVLGPRGSGKTTLLRAVESELPDLDRAVVYVDLGPAQSAEEALLVIADALNHPWGATEVLRSGLSPKSTPSAKLLERVRHLGGVEPSLLLIDSPPGDGQAHTLFGRLRDELWRLPHQWVVAADMALRDELARPPANAFFEASLKLAPLTVEQQRDFLARRLADEADVGIEAMLDQTDGWPRSLLQLARESVLAGVDDALIQQDRRTARLADLPDTASTIIDFIADHGPTSGSDRDLLSTLGVSGQRARQVLRDLEQQGLVTSFSEQEERRGRPRKLYDLGEEIT